MDKEELKQALLERYEKLNELWLDAEDKIAALNCPKAVILDETQKATLAWIRVSGEYRICVGVQGESKKYRWVFTPITDAKLQYRLEMVSQYPALLEAVKTKGCNTMAAMDAAMIEFQKLLGE